MLLNKASMQMEKSSNLAFHNLVELICPLPGIVQGQAGWGSEQPAPVEGVPAHGRGVGTR